MTIYNREDYKTVLPQLEKSIKKSFNKVNERIDEFADYLLEEGTDGDWTYRKWNSGVAECWGIVDDGTYSPSSTWGNGAYMHINIAFPTDLFASTPTLTVTANKPYGNGMPFVSVDANGKTGFGVFLFDPNQSANNYPYEINAYALGKWK